MVHPVEAHNEVSVGDAGPRGRVQRRVADERDAAVRAAAGAPAAWILGKQPAQPAAWHRHVVRTKNSEVTSGSPTPELNVG